MINLITAKKVLLPTYPFQRERYWVGSIDFIDHVETYNNYLYRLTWKQINLGISCDSSLFSSFKVNSLQDEAKIVDASSLPSKISRDFLSYLNQTAVGHIAKAISSVMELTNQIDYLDINELLSSGVVLSKYKRLISRWMDILCEFNIAENIGECRWKVFNYCGFLETAKDLTLGASSIKEKAIANIVTLFSEQLSNILQGSILPTSLLFPLGSSELLNPIYQASLSSKELLRLNKVFSYLDKSVSARRRPLRILEVGAGTGGLTGQVLPLLDNLDYQYTYTDVTPYFESTMEENFSEYDSIEFKLLDLTINPMDQGFMRDSYDIVLAANVVHATPDIRTSLDCICQLLSSGGMFVLLEAVSSDNLGWI